jgi:hypothetical protein
LLGDLICSRVPENWHDACLAIAAIEIHEKIPRAVAMFVVLYCILWVLAQVNGIRRRVTLKSASVVRVPSLRDHPAINLRRDAFTNSAAADASNGKVARVKLWYLNGNGKTLVKANSIPRSSIVAVNAIDKQNALIPPGGLGVDKLTWEALDAFMERRGNNPALPAAKFRVRISGKLRGVRFLLRHPDVTLRTAGWVTALTGIFTILNSLLLGA